MFSGNSKGCIVISFSRGLCREEVEEEIEMGQEGDGWWMYRDDVRSVSHKFHFANQDKHN